LSDESGALDSLMSRLAHVYNSLSFKELELARDAAPGTPCAARFSEDQKWYRAELCSVAPPDVVVSFVDYGNSEAVEAESLKSLRREFAALPRQAVRCELAGVRRGADVSRVADPHVDAATPLAMEVVEVGRDAVVVSLRDPATGACLNRELGAAAATTPEPEEGIPLPPLAEVESVYVTAVEGPARFHGQLTKLPSEGLEEFQERLYAHYERGGEPGLFEDGGAHVGDFCVVRFSLDDGWYRGRVLPSDGGGEAHVRFVDYGNAERRPPRLVRHIAREFRSFPQHAIECELASPPQGLAGAELRALLQDSTIEVRVVARGNANDATCTVELTDKDSLGSSAPPATASFTAVAVREGTNEEVAVVHLNGPEEIYVQLLRSSDDLQATMRRLQAYGDAAKPGDAIAGRPPPNATCAARYSADDMWYRCRVVAATPSGDADVCFVDYGNVERMRAGALLRLPAELLSLPAQAVRCSLRGTAGMTGRRDELAEMIADEVVTARFVERSRDGYVVEMTDARGGSVSERYREKTQAPAAPQQQQQPAERPPTKPQVISSGPWQGESGGRPSNSSRNAPDAGSWPSNSSRNAPDANSWPSNSSRNAPDAGGRASNASRSAPDSGWDKRMDVRRGDHDYRTEDHNHARAAPSGGRADSRDWRRPDADDDWESGDTT
ncbi:PREDICTED: tudor domain-containing protein 1-like, partial [Priapulus caudatus]|uniref:Tudor domain-containing protein 1-like n=1 Tax=Priapulus caudatus TaxID=37621 RepID=A0ABM1F6U3_PRICU